MGGASQSQLKCFLFEQHSTPKLSDVRKDAQNHTFKNSEVLDVAARVLRALFPGHNLKGGGAPETAKKILFGLERFCIRTLCCSNPIADLTTLGDNVST